jgi:hypothetical protein
MIPDYRAIVHVEAILANVAKPHGAVYEGFGSFGNAAA